MNTPLRARIPHRRIGVLGTLLAVILLSSAAGRMVRSALAETPTPNRPANNDVAVPASIAEIKSLERRIQNVIDQVRPAVVHVSGASGVVVSRDGLVMSVAHVGGHAGRAITFTFPDGRTAHGVTLGNDRPGDAALMKITDEGPWPFVPMGRAEDLEEGQWCLAIGYPVSFGTMRGPSVRIGRVLHHCPIHVITDCTIMGGDSGGPLFDLAGRLIGISSTCDDSVLKNVHVSLARFRKNWDRLLRGEDIEGGPAFLGVINSSENELARVDRVVEGSAAEKAGIRKGDIILKFGDQPIRTYDELRALVRREEPGDTVEVLLRRGENVLRVQVTLGKPNE